MDKKKTITLAVVIVLAAVTYFFGADVANIVKDSTNAAPIITEVSPVTSE